MHRTDEEEEFAMATNRLKTNKSAQLHFVQSAALTRERFSENRCRIVRVYIIKRVYSDTSGRSTKTLLIG